MCSTNLVFGHLRPERHVPWKGEQWMMRGKLVLGIQTGNKDWSMVQTPDKMSNVFDFLAENDHEPDSNGECTCATLEAGALSDQSLSPFALRSSLRPLISLELCCSHCLVMMGSHGQKLTSGPHPVTLNHTCKKRVMWRRRLFWPKKICGKSA